METPEIELKIKVMYEDELILHCHEGDTVKQLKQLISEKTSIPVDHQKLIFRGRVLDDDKLLSECNVEDRCVLSLIKVEVGWILRCSFHSLDLYRSLRNSIRIELKGPMFSFHL